MITGVLWGDLDTTNRVDDRASTVFYGTAQVMNRHAGTAMTAAVIQYQRVGYCCVSSAPDYGPATGQHVANPEWGNTYEAILFANGDILLQYKEIMQGGSQQPSIGCIYTSNHPGINQAPECLGYLLTDCLCLQTRATMAAGGRRSPMAGQTLVARWARVCLTLTRRRRPSHHLWHT